MAAEAKAARMYRDEIETLKVQVCVYTYKPIELHVHTCSMYL